MTTSVRASKQQQQQQQTTRSQHEQPPTDTIIKEDNGKGNYNFKSFLLIIFSAILIRIILFYQGFDQLFSNRNEITTPLTSFKRLVEGLHLRELGLSPYAGSAYHQPPLVLLLFYPFVNSISIGIDNNINNNSNGIEKSQILFLLIDCLIAIALREIAKQIPKVLPNEMKSISTHSNLPNITAALYLFNPFTIFTCVGMSTINLTNLAIVLSLYYSLKGMIFQSIFSVAMASYLSIYPVILILPCTLILKHHFFPPDQTKPVAQNQLSSEQSKQLKQLLENNERPMLLLFYFRIFAFFFLSISSLFYLSFTFLNNSWEFIEKSYKFTFFVEDLTPNIGLFWYYFIEVFDHFRNLFLFIFQYHVFIYCIPLAIRLKEHPLFYFWSLCAIIATFKSYPALGDTALHVSLLPLLYQPLKGVKYSFIVIVVAIFVTVLAPILWQMWIYQGTGNANFYYTINLVFTIAQVLLIVDSLSVLLKLDYVNKINLKKKSQENNDQQQEDHKQTSDHEGSSQIIDDNNNENNSEENDKK
ncbi:hypothetical protein RB653_006278 [Dictyostelium firmibasis]|uniref:GPI transamidase subunit PIG-U family protein n=1 Tax=Dictyostelium firmibasis TaxID=79012 RepID=A0AAN7Z1W5_9MYCE